MQTSGGFRANLWWGLGGGGWTLYLPQDIRQCRRQKIITRDFPYNSNFCWRQFSTIHDGGKNNERTHTFCVGRMKRSRLRELGQVDELFPVVTNLLFIPVSCTNGRQ